MASELCFSVFVEQLYRKNRATFAGTGVSLALADVAIYIFAFESTQLGDKEYVGPERQ